MKTEEIPLERKVKTALDESRILILAAQVLLGFEFNSAFEPGYEKLSEAAKVLHASAFLLTVITFGLLNTPASFHRLVEKGNVTPWVHACLNRFMKIAVLPLAAAMSLNLYAITELRLGALAAACLSGLNFLAAVYFWYGLEYQVCRRRETA